MHGAGEIRYHSFLTVFFLCGFIFVPVRKLLYYNCGLRTQNMDTKLKWKKVLGSDEINENSSRRNVLWTIINDSVVGSPV